MTAEQKAALKQATLDLIARVHRIHRSGSGSLPVSDLISMFGITDAPAELVMRGNFMVQRRDERTGTFSNTGDSFGFNPQGLAIEVPPVLQGEYEVCDSRLSLRLDPNATITAKKLFIRAALACVVASDAGIDVEINGPIPLPATKIRFDEPECEPRT